MNPVHMEHYNKGTAGDTLYRVTVQVSGTPDFTMDIWAPRVGLAETRVMVHYPYPLVACPLVEFDMEEIGTWA